MSSSDMHEVRFAYGLWGIMWFFLGFVSVSCVEERIKWFYGLVTVAVFSVWVAYELMWVKLVRESVFLCTVFMLCGTACYAVATVIEHVLSGVYTVWDAVVTVVVVAYVGFGVAINVRKDLIKGYRVRAK